MSALHRSVTAPFAFVFACVAALVAGCAPQKQPVIPHAAFVMREAERHAIEGSDTTRARVVYPEFVGARTPEALDSLRATVHALVVAPPPGRHEAARSVAALLDDFVAHWNAEREARHLHEYWRFERRVEVRADTLGLVALVATDRGLLGSDGSPRRVSIVLIGADDGRRRAFETLEGAATDSSGAVARRLLASAGRER